MKNVSGIEFKKDHTGKAKSVTIDLQKHGEALQVFLETVGASIPEDDDFEKKWNEGIDGDELIKRVHTHLKTLPWKKE
jgi:hypothetical protein